MVTGDPGHPIVAAVPNVDMVTRKGLAFASYRSPNPTSKGFAVVDLAFNASDARHTHHVSKDWMGFIIKITK